MKHLKVQEAYIQGGTPTDNTGTYIANQTKFEKKIVDKCRQLGMDADDLEVFTSGKQSVKAHLALSKWRLANRQHLTLVKEYQGELFETKKFTYYSDIDIKEAGDVQMAECLISMVPIGMHDKFDMGCFVASQKIVDALLDGSPPDIADTWEDLSDEEKSDVNNNKEFFI